MRKLEVQIGSSRSIFVTPWRYRMRSCLRLSFLLLILTCGVALAQSALNNDAVTKMVKAGLADDTILAMIKSQPGTYRVDTDSVIQMKKDGVSDKLIGAMIEKNSGVSTPAVVPPVPAVAPVVDEIGVYYKNKDDKWIEMMPEVVNWKTGGALKRFASQGIVKGDVNGHIEGKNSKNSLNTPLNFLVYVPEGTAITEYQLLRLHDSGNSREFRSVTGGVIHSSGGAQRDEVNFEGKKIAPRMYEIVLGSDVKTGEFGFLPPGATSSSNMASSGKMYTFHVIE
jgi:hypothetical protein